MQSFRALVAAVPAKRSELQRQLQQAGAPRSFVVWVADRSLEQVWDTCADPVWMVWLIVRFSGQPYWPTVKDITTFIYLAIAFGVEDLDHRVHTLGEQMVDHLFKLRRARSEKSRAKAVRGVDYTAGKLIRMATAAKLLAEVLGEPVLGTRGLKAITAAVPDPIDVFEPERIQRSVEQLAGGEGIPMDQVHDTEVHDGDSQARDD